MPVCARCAKPEALLSQALCWSPLEILSLGAGCSRFLDLVLAGSWVGVVLPLMSVWAGVH